MSSGLLALMAVADRTKTASAYPVSISTGQSIVTGRVAPSSSWYPLVVGDLEAQLEVMAGKVPRANREAALREIAKKIGEVKQQMREVFEAEVSPCDEVTLHNATVFPAIAREGTQPGGLRLTVIRVPLASVQHWWMVEPRSIPGDGGTDWVGAALSLAFGVPGST